MRANFIVIPLFVIAIAVIGKLFTAGGMEWYQTIIVPQWTPSGHVIGVIWTVIFTISAVSALLAYNYSAGSRQTTIMFLLILNAALNMLWSWLFFTEHLIGAAVWEAGALGLSVLVLIVAIRPISSLAALLLVPYLGWVSFATYLSFRIWELNR